MSAVLASTLAPGTIYLLRGDRPLVLRANRKLRAIAYASEARFLDFILEDLPGWHPFPLPPMTLARFDREDIFHPELYSVSIIAQETPAIRDLPIQTMPQSGRPQIDKIKLPA